MRNSDEETIRPTQKANLEYSYFRNLFQTSWYEYIFPRNGFMSSQNFTCRLISKFDGVLLKW